MNFIFSPVGSCLQNDNVAYETKGSAIQPDSPIFVTKPFLPPLEEFKEYLENIWTSRQLTNKGHYHEVFESKLAEHLGVKYVSLFSNGTLALISALQALRITGEVITTPYSFVATTHALHWNGIKPVFCDIDPETYNLDPNKIEAAITPKTTAIMPVHVYGTPCDVDRIQDIAGIYGLRVIYDACHAFGVTVENNSVLNFGDLSVISFHATKVFTTFEGGAIISHDEITKRRIDFLKNFGFAGETTVVAPGINAKMNEFQAALGVLQLNYIDRSIQERRRISENYRKHLEGVPGVSFCEPLPGVRHNYSYFPIFIDKGVFGKSRDDVYAELKKRSVFSRRYFYPLISQFPTYKGLDSARLGNLPVAEKIAQEVLCLPIYPGLNEPDVHKIVSIIHEQSKSAYRITG
jgi:dTDP-4-amino-4,6-dideoxygalactose transaminase